MIFRTDKILPSPFNEMLENYNLAKDKMPNDFNSKHWDVFPSDYEKTILSTNSWKNFLRNSISIGYNDELMDLENTRWNKDKNNIDVWALRKNHDHRILSASVGDVKKLTDTFNLISSICTLDFVLSSIASNNGMPVTGKAVLKTKEASVNLKTGEKLEIVKESNIITSLTDLMHIYYFWQISRTIDTLKENLRPTICEIGSGYGLLASKLKKKYPHSRCILFDLPELSAVQTYYLNTEFPDAKVFYYRDLLDKGSSIFDLDFDFLILPGWMMDSVPEKYIDVVINMRSMMEMKQKTIQYYFENIHRIVKEGGIFANFNRYDKDVSGELASGEISTLKLYPYDDYWSILISQSSILQNNIHDLITKREDVKMDLTVSEALKSLPPFDVKQ